MAQICDSSNWQADAGELNIAGQLGLHSETMSGYMNKIKNKMFNFTLKTIIKQMTHRWTVDEKNGLKIDF